jgi:hypothetical protein
MVLAGPEFLAAKITRNVQHEKKTSLITPVVRVRATGCPSCLESVLDCLASGKHLYYPSVAGFPGHVKPNPEKAQDFLGEPEV